MKSRVVLILILLLVAFGLTRLIQSGSAEVPQKDAATPVQFGVITERQRAHSKLYERYSKDRKIDELLKTEEGDVFLQRLPPLGADVSSVPPLTATEILQRLTCNSDVVVIVVVKAKTSQITEDRGFIFTDYEVAVEEVLKSGSAAVVEPNSQITVTRPGGTVLVNGRKVRASDESIQLLNVGERYMLFLQLFPATGAYHSVDSGESFHLRGSKVKSLQESYSRVAAEHTTSSLINEVRIVAGHPCVSRKGGR